jgi:hypothetical protein
MISEVARRQIRLTARCCLRDLGLPFSAWSLAKLAEYLVAADVVASVNWETPRRHHFLLEAYLRGSG